MDFVKIRHHLRSRVSNFIYVTFCQTYGDILRVEAHYNQGDHMCNENLCSVAFVLDRSGSMESMRHQAIAGYNEFLESQIQYPGETRFSLTLFNQHILEVARSVPVAQMIHLDAGTYLPGGNTALDDAVGITIDTLGRELANTPEPERPGKVIVAILTDGQENASIHYTTSRVANMIRRQTEQYNWEFIYLGAGPNVERESAARGIASKDAITFEATREGLTDVLASLKRNVNDRKGKKR